MGLTNTWKWYNSPAYIFDNLVGVRDGKYVYTPPGTSIDDAMPLTPEQLKLYQKHIALPGLHEADTAYAKAMADAIAPYTPNVPGLLNNLRRRLSPEALAFWDSFRGTEHNAFLESYGDDLSYDNVMSDLEELAALGKMPEIETFEMPLMSDYIQSDEDIYKDIDRTLSEWYNSAYERLTDVYDTKFDALRDVELGLLDDLSQTKDLYNSQLGSLNNTFTQQSSALRSQQYLANAQTYDALRSDLRKSRQNALEAGASAGVRIAGNVNALLTAQNKQSATAMETSNALAEMLLQHRNAVSGMTRDFANYRSGINRALSENRIAKADAANEVRTGLNDLSTQKLGMRDTMYTNKHTAQTNNYNTAMTDYNAKTYNAGIGANKWVEDVQAAEDAGNPFAGAYLNWARK